MKWNLFKKKKVVTEPTLDYEKIKKDLCKEGIHAFVKTGTKELFESVNLYLNDVQLKRKIIYTGYECRDCGKTKVDIYKPD